MLEIFRTLLLACLIVPASGRARAIEPAAPSRETAPESEAAVAKAFNQQFKLLGDDDGAIDDFFGYSVAIDGDTAVVGVPRDDLKRPGNLVDVDRGSVYVFMRIAGLWQFDQKLLAPDGAEYDWFGVDVALDGQRLVAGTFAERAYVFREDAGSWVWEQTLSASDGGAHDAFGYSVDISNDAVIVGAFGDERGAPNVQDGSAYLFARVNGAWVQQFKIFPNDEPGAFGLDVAIEGNAAFVGAYDSAYVFLGNAGVWNQLQKLQASDGTAGDGFGRALAVSGDRLLVGAPFRLDMGAAYLFEKVGALYVEQNKMALSTPKGGDHFGYAVALSGDTAVIGAMQRDDGSSVNQGAAYVFTNNGVSWSVQSELKASDPHAFDYFANSVAIDGNLVLVGSGFDYNETPPALEIDTGAVYPFTRSGTSWVTEEKLDDQETSADDRFGASVAVSGDVAVVGAPFDDSVQFADQGGAFVFRRTGSFWTFEQKLIAPDAGAGMQFGAAVDIDGETIAVGAPSRDGTSGNADEGAVYVYRRGNGTWNLQALLSASDENGQESFGASVSISGDTLAIGAPGREGITLGSPRGAVYVYSRVDGTWGNEQLLLASDGTPGDQLGSSVTLSAGTLLAGAPGFSGTKGSAVAFERGLLGDWAQTQRLIAPDGAALDAFGWSVAIWGDVALIGAPLRDSGALIDAGAAYRFSRAGAWAFTDLLPSMSPGPNAYYGWSVAVNGPLALVGAPFAGPAARGAVTSHVLLGDQSTPEKLLTAVDGADGDWFGYGVDLSGSISIIGAPKDDFGSSVDRGAAYTFFDDAAAKPDELFADSFE